MADSTNFKQALDQFIAARKQGSGNMQLRLVVPQSDILSLEIQDGDTISTYTPTAADGNVLFEMREFLAAEFDASASKLGIRKPSPIRY